MRGNEEDRTLSAYEPDYYTPGDPGDPLPPARRDKRLVTPVEAVLIVALVVIALVSAFPVRAHFSSATAYEHTIEKLDDKRNIVLGLTTAATGASVAITAIPDDTGTPIAERLMDLAGDLGIVLIAIYLEKYLLTIFGFTAFALLVPAACILLVGAVIAHRRSAVWASLANVAVKLVLMGVVLVATVPVSVGITDMIEQTYSISISEDTGAVEDAGVAAEEAGQAEDAGESVEDAEQAEGTAEESGGFLVDAWEYLSSIPSLVGNAAGELTSDLLESVGNLIDGFAVLIIVTCIVPIGVLAFFLWVANLVTGIDVSSAMRTLKPRTVGNVRNDLHNLRNRKSGRA